MNDTENNINVPEENKMSLSEALELLQFKIVLVDKLASFFASLGKQV